MAKLFSWKALLTLIGALVIGALGSGVWDYLFKPAFIWGGSALLDIATLGTQSLIDGVYFEVAKGSHERAGNAAYQAIMTMMCVSGVAIPLFCLLAIKRSTRANSRGMLDISSSRLPTVFFALSVLQAVFAGVLVIQTVRLSYIVKASNYIEQCERIVAPYISPDERLIKISAIAQIQSKSDYVAIINGIRDVANTKGIRLPPFDIF